MDFLETTFEKLNKIDYPCIIHQIIIKFNGGNSISNEKYTHIWNLHFNVLTLEI